MCKAVSCSLLILFSLLEISFIICKSKGAFLHRSHTFMQLLFTRIKSIALQSPLSFTANTCESKKKLNKSLLQLLQVAEKG